MDKIFEDIENQNISDDIYCILLNLLDLMCSISIFLLEDLRRNGTLYL